MNLVRSPRKRAECVGLVTFLRLIKIYSEVCHKARNELCRKHVGHSRVLVSPYCVAIGMRVNEFAVMASFDTTL
jgi:hypothetical protein